MCRSDGAVYSPTGDGEYLGDISSVFTREAPSTSTRRELLENVLTEITTVKSLVFYRECRRQCGRVAESGSAAALSIERLEGRR